MYGKGELSTLRYRRLFNDNNAAAIFQVSPWHVVNGHNHIIDVYDEENL